MMSSFFLRRLAHSLVAILGVVLLVFFLQRLTGDPVQLMAAEGATEEDLQMLRVTLGLDQPLLVQLWTYLSDLVRLDLGTSLTQRVPVTDIIWSRIPFTLQLAGGALLVALGLGCPLGIWMGMRRGKFESGAIMGFTLVAQSLPTFWSGIMLIMVFAVGLGWFPPSGAQSWWSLVLPSIALGMLSMATFARVTRSAILDELSKDYIRTARAKGVGSGRLVWRHLMRNSSIPLVTVLALEIANLLAGAVIVETVFAWPGLGTLTVQAINARDFPVVQGVVLLGAAVAILLNLVADLLYEVIDPRIRLDATRP